jgi:hypothetical protein
MHTPDLAAIAAEICPGAPLDLGIAWAVKVLRDGGVETYESCEGGGGHAYPYPCVRFFGTDAAGWHALSIAITHQLPVLELARLWTIQGNQPNGPCWEMRFSPPCSRTFHTSEVRPFPAADSAAQPARHSGNPRTRGTPSGRSDRPSSTERMDSPSPPPLNGSDAILIPHDSLSQAAVEEAS